MGSSRSRHFILFFLASSALLLAGACGPAHHKHSTTALPPGIGIGTGACPAGGVCFFALGDTGIGDDQEYAVANMIAAKCAADGCDFGLLLGDLIYEQGALAPADPQFQTKFALPYAAVTGPIHAVLGNHDYNGTGDGRNWGQEANYLGYAASQAKFSLPGGAVSYAVTAGPVLLLGLDTQRILYDPAGDVSAQAALAAAAIAASAAPWRIAFGHHPYRSNGPHGNAGYYDSGATFPDNGLRVKNFIETSVCGQVDLYLSGHDHSQQVFAPALTCPRTTLIVSGAGAKLTAFPNTNTPAPLFARSALGFAYLRVSPSRLQIEMLDSAGGLEFSLELP